MNLTYFNNHNTFKTFARQKDTHNSIEIIRFLYLYQKKLLTLFDLNRIPQSSPKLVKFWPRPPKKLKIANSKFQRVLTTWLTSDEKSKNQLDMYRLIVGWKSLIRWDKFNIALNSIDSCRKKSLKWRYIKMYA